MRILATRVFKGPNIYACVPVIAHRLALAPAAEGALANLGTDMADRLAAVLLNVPAADATPPSVVAAGSALLQRMAGEAIDFHGTAPENTPHVHHVAFAYGEPVSGLAASQFMVELILHILPERLRDGGTTPQDFDPAAARDRLILAARHRAPDYYVAPLIAAAQARDIPWRRPTTASRMVELGQGRFRRRIYETALDSTGRIATSLSNSKPATLDLLADVGLPVPRQARVRTGEEAIQAATDLGYPVAVKPANANKGVGVSLSLTNGAAVETSFREARRHGSMVLVESMIAGLDHRLLVVGGRFVAATNRRPGGVVGDGKSSVRDLVTATNHDPRRGPHTWNHLGLLELDDEALSLLRARDMTPDSVVPAGEEVFLRRLAFLPEGGGALDVTDRIHADNKAMAELAARVVGLDVAGIDFVTPDIGRSWRTGAGAICEVNAMPSFRPHLAADGDPPDVAGPILDLLIPPGVPTRVPLAVVVGGDPRPVADDLERMLAAAGHVVGRASPRGVTVGGASVRPVRGRLDPLETAVYHPDVDAAVYETTAAALARDGLSVDRCRVTAILDAGDGAQAPLPIGRAAIGFLVRVTEGPVVVASDGGAALLPEGSREVWEADKVAVEMAGRHGSLNEADSALRVAAVVARGMGVTEDKLFRILENLAR